MKKIDHFTVHNLNGERTIKVSFHENKKIIVSDNGYGKTSVINLLYGFLKQSKHVLNYNFSSLELKTNNSNIVMSREIIKLAFSKYNELQSSLSDLSFAITENEKQLKNAIKIIKSNSFLFSILLYSLTQSPSTISLQEIISSNYKDLSEESINKYIREIKTALMKYDNGILIDEIKIDFDNLIKEINLLPKQETIHGYIDLIQESYISLLKFCDGENFIHFPTYRIIEKDIREFVKSEDIGESDFYTGVDDVETFFKENDTINFGVNVVQHQWTKISESLRTKTTENYLRSSGSLLYNALSRKEITNEESVYIKDNLGIINTVLARLPDEIISKGNKKMIKTMLSNTDFYEDSSNNTLFSLLINMIEIYSNLKPINNLIEKYCSTLNKFLYKKENGVESFSSKSIYFNETSSEIQILNKKGDRLSVDNLSYGEKQIVTIFTKIFLMDFESRDNKYWIFMDEPEISLSFEWQCILLPEIINSGKCKFLFTSTHSPFIFQNDLKKYTSDLSLESWEIEK